MEERKIKLIIGSILHDIGKVAYRSGDGRRHSISGLDFLKDECKINDPEILDSVEFHHMEDLKNKNLPKDSLAYISYIADNIAAMSDRREKEFVENRGFNRNISLSSVFNILNGNNTELKYQPKFLNHENGINLPTDEIEYDSSYYKDIIENLNEALAGINYDKKYLDSLLKILEGYLNYVPASTSLKEIQDISLFDHLKLTSAIASCIYDYFEANNLDDYTVLINDSKNYYNKEMFYLYSLDLSGIQSFIYTIIDSKALKSLRTRSFYLEIFMEDVIDNVLEKLGLTRANLLYSGGGHAYLLLPNTENAIKTIEKLREETNDWLVKLFGSELYLAGGGAKCSANTLSNKPEESYTELFKSVSKELSKSKLNRYTFSQIKELNFKDEEPGSRECKICKRIDMLKQEADICNICDQIIAFSNQILFQDFFAVVENEYDKNRPYLPLPFGRKLLGFKKEELIKDLAKDEGVLRVYSKNEIHTGKNFATNLWIGDYSFDNELKKLTDESKGIKRLAALRADVDNLGKAFVKGFDNKNRSLTRSAVFSREMSLFFKYHINYILENGKYSIENDEPIKRRALIVYSGGDDVFLLGAWKDIIEFSIDLKNYLKEFTIDTLSISAGIGLFADTFPVKAMAKMTGELEECAKDYSYTKENTRYSKNAVCIFEPNLVFSWEEFEKNVLEEKLKFLLYYYDKMDEIGNSLMYKLIELIRNSKESINIARLAYLLARLEERMKTKDEDRKFSKTIYRWVKDKENKELIAAIYILIYMRR
ncbi:MAG: type III-A CRISPR-associated protein Cas10/Csm1 [Tissierellia bacterium]|nr:type III-A CRISPR-associated protein Cas10/Csm1 [Tissierellia bacterium]